MDLDLQLDTLLEHIQESLSSLDTDTVQEFIDKHVIYSDDNYLSVGDFHRTYARFCTQYGYKPFPLSQLAPKLRKCGLTVTSGRGSRFYVRNVNIVGIEVILTHYNSKKK